MERVRIAVVVQSVPAHQVQYIEIPVRRRVDKRLVEQRKQFLVENARILQRIPQAREFVHRAVIRVKLGNVAPHAGALLI